MHRIRNDTPLRDIPGPWLASCSPLWRFWYAVCKSNYHHDLTNLHRKYGNIVRIAPNEVSVWDPEYVSEIYSHGENVYPKCDMYDIALPNGFFNLAVERDIKTHTLGRRAIAKDYSMTAILKSEKYFDAVIKDFITALDKNFAQTGKKCNFTVWSEYFTYDMITDIVFGKSFGFCNAARDVEGGLRDLRQMLNLSPFLSYLPWIWPLTQLEIIKKTGMKHYARCMVREIQKRVREGNPTGRQDLLQGLMDARYQDGHALPLGEITNHAYIFVLAAPDTASVALRNIIINLCRNRDVYQQLMDSLLALNTANPTWKDLQNIPLLTAVVKETLRLHPPAGFSLPRAVPAGGRTVCGKFLPENTTIGMSAWSVHANTEYWGEDTLEFKPERWMDPNQMYKLERHSLIFGQGSRQCLGKHIAMINLVKVTAQILLNFDFGLLNEKNIKEVFLLLVVVDGMDVWFKRRAGGPLDDTIGSESEKPAAVTTGA
ncbi:cytochrome P450 [Morchella conica CCBAS932]|uniref:Cytochrome P450 n=2 Tax=Morchella sect. Distantes TaxID=1051054 RepID=A0A3N4L032_9PEZI|nr:cytochrome P450 [Morchella conica CCBAS932]